MIPINSKISTMIRSSNTLWSGKLHLRMRTRANQKWNLKTQAKRKIIMRSSKFKMRTMRARNLMKGLKMRLSRPKRRMGYKREKTLMKMHLTMRRWIESKGK